MQKLANTLRKNGFLHHAYTLVGDADLVLNELNAFIETELGIKVRGNPDYQFQEFETFGIDEARALSLSQSRKSFTSGKKIFVISLQSITSEAQNALLKVLEEPTTDTHFFFITDSSQKFIPTVLSRIQIIEIHGSESREREIYKVAEKFLDLPIAEKLAEALRISESKNKKDAKALLESLESFLGGKIKKEETSKETINTLEEVMNAKKYLGDRAPSVKMLLEHIAIIL